MELHEKIEQAKEIIQKEGGCPNVGILDCTLCVFNVEEMCPNEDELLNKAKVFLFDNGISIKNMEE